MRSRRLVLGAGALVLGLTVAAVAASSGDGSGGGDARSAAQRRSAGAGGQSPSRPIAQDVGSTTAPGSPVLPITTTTMPPRALPAILAPLRSGVLDGRVVVVDPGHNGDNVRHAEVRRPAEPGAGRDADAGTDADAGPGSADDATGPLCNTVGAATAGGTAEHEINWEIGRRVALILRTLGAAVVLTHADNEGFGPCADERGELARLADADAFVSIHADGAPTGANGFHVIHPASHPRLRPESVALSAALALVVRDELLVIGGRPASYVGRRGVQERGDLANLNHADRPSVLIELGNLRNATDAAMLLDATSVDLLARALSRAVVRFLGTTPSAAQISADPNGDGLVDLLLGAPEWMLPTTTTSTTTTTTTATTATTATTSTTTASSTTVPPPDTAPTTSDQ